MSQDEDELGAGPGRGGGGGVRGGGERWPSAVGGTRGGMSDDEEVDDVGMRYGRDVGGIRLGDER